MMWLFCLFHIRTLTVCQYETRCRGFNLKCTAVCTTHITTDPLVPIIIREDALTLVMLIWGSLEECEVYARTRSEHHPC